MNRSQLRPEVRFVINENFLIVLLSIWEVTESKKSKFQLETILYLGQPHKSLIYQMYKKFFIYLMDND